MLPEYEQGLELAGQLCLQVLPLMLLGCLAGSVFVFSQWGWRCGKLLEPLARMAGLGPQSATYLALCLLNQVAANAYLTMLLRNRIVPERRLLGTYLVGWLPASCHYYVFYFAPILLPGLGMRIGCTVLGLYFLASLLICVSGMLLLRTQKTFSPDSASWDREAAPLPDWPGAMAVFEAGIKQFLRIASVFVPCILIIAVLLNLPPAHSFIEGLGALLAQIGLPRAGIVVVLTALPSMMGGFATAIASIHQGTLSHEQIVPVIFLAAFGHALFSAFSHFLPTNMAIFGPRRGARLTFASLCVRIPCLALVLFFAFAFGNEPFV
jgi:hypothetical protein